MKYFTVIAEKATRHIPDNNIRNRPHRGTAQQSRIISINLKVGNENLTIKFISFILFLEIFFSMLCYNHTVLCPGDEVYRRSIVSSYQGMDPQRNDPVPVPPVDQSQPHSPVVTLHVSV
jgi:hypothetical protein